MGKSRQDRSSKRRLNSRELKAKRYAVTSFIELVGKVALEIATKKENENIPDLFFLTRSALDVLERIKKSPIGTSKREMIEHSDVLRGVFH